mmetsp:Transcript_9230/g.37968  ORF Transcript_9230/g.37968 Transcript_9230/m.37968 type:complete len:292 (+) Transcript_9230:440-1315(+)
MEKEEVQTAHSPVSCQDEAAELTEERLLEASSVPGILTLLVREPLLHMAEHGLSNLPFQIRECLVEVALAVFLVAVDGLQLRHGAHHWNGVQQLTNLHLALDSIANVAHLHMGNNHESKAFRQRNGCVCARLVVEPKCHSEMDERVQSIGRCPVRNERRQLLQNVGQLPRTHPLQIVLKELWKVLLHSLILSPVLSSDRKPCLLPLLEHVAIRGVLLIETIERPQSLLACAHALQCHEAVDNVVAQISAVEDVVLLCRLCNELCRESHDGVRSSVFLSTWLTSSRIAICTC